MISFHRQLTLCIVFFAVAGRATDRDVSAFDATQRVSRWALLVAEPLRQSGVGDLLAAQLSTWEEVSLLERAELDKVVAELELTAAELVDPASAPKLGRLLKAEAILYLEQTGDGEAAALRLLVLEARTGIPLAQWVVPRSDVEREVDQMLQTLQRAHATLRLPDAKRRYVGIVAVHNEEAGPLLSPVAQSLAALAEQDLKATAGVMLLDRDLAFRLRSGVRLTDDEKLIRGATQLIDIGLRREDVGYRVSLVIRRPTAEPQSAFFITKSRELKEVRSELARALRGAIDAPHEVVAPPDPRREVEQLSRTYEWLRQINRSNEAIPIAEALQALEPSKDHWRNVQASYESSAWGHKTNAHNWRIAGKHAESHAALLQALTLAVRLEEHNRAAIETIDAAEIGRYIDPGFDPFYMNIDWFADESPECRELRERYDALRLERFEFMRERGRCKLRPLDHLMEGRLRTAGYFAKDPADFCATVEALMREVDALSATLPSTDALPHEYIAAALSAINSVQEENAPDFMRRPLPRWPSDRLAPLTKFLLAAEKPMHTALANYILCQAADERGCAAARRLFDQYLALPADDGFPYHGFSLRGRANSCLRRAGQLEAYAVDLMRRVEERPQLMLHHPEAFDAVMHDLSDKIRGELYLRSLRCLDGQQLTPEETERVAPLRLNMRLDVERLGLAKPAVVDSGAWKNFEVTEIKITDKLPQGVEFNTIAVALATDERRDEVGRLWRTPRGKGGVSRIEIASGKVLWTSTEFPYVDAPADYPLGTLVLAPDAAFVATERGIAMLHDNEAEFFGPDEGAPGKAIWCLGWYDGQVYVAYENCIAAFDPATKRFALLASASKLQGRHKLDGGENYGVKNFLPDPARRCLWLQVDSGHNEQSPLGIWKFTPATSEFRHVFWPRDYPHPWSNLTCSADAIVVAARDKWWEIDLDNGVAKQRDDFSPFREKHDGRHQVRELVRVGDAIFGVNGQCFTPDGKVHRHPEFPKWMKIVACRDGFLAAGIAASDGDANPWLQQRVWHVRPLATNKHDAP